MNRKYKARGIILKGSSMKESDRLVTVLTPEYGIIRAVAPGAKKLKSSLRGRTELFVVNELVIIRGRSLDKIIQADTVYTYPGLSQDIGKLAAAQYLAELCLYLAVDEQPQAELYELLNEHLSRIEDLPLHKLIYPCLSQAVFHLIVISGLAPQVYNCCLTEKLISPDLANEKWQIGFSFEGGGVVDLSIIQTTNQNIAPHHEDAEAQYNNRLPKIDWRINSLELTLLQQLSLDKSPDTSRFDLEKFKNFNLDQAWIRVEKVLREYIQYHIGRTIRSANLVDSLYVEF